MTQPSPYFTDKETEAEELPKSHPHSCSAFLPKDLRLLRVAEAPGLPSEESNPGKSDCLENDLTSPARGAHRWVSWLPGLRL